MGKHWLEGVYGTTGWPGRGDSCWPPLGPGGQEIIFHQGACSTLDIEIVCDRGASVPLLNRICRNSDDIIFGLTIVAALAVGVVAGAAVVALAGGSAGIFIPTGGAFALAGGGSTGAGIVLSPAAAAVGANALAGAGTFAGLQQLIHLASGNNDEPMKKHHGGGQSNVSENELTDQIADTLDMTEHQSELLHRAISKQGYSPEVIWDIAYDILTKGHY